MFTKKNEWMRSLIRILSFRTCFTYDCFISITFCFIFCIYCFDHEDDYLIKKEWVHMYSSNFALSCSIVSVICLFFSMFNTCTQNSLDNSSANKACSSSIYFLLSTIETIVCVVFIISDSRWSKRKKDRNDICKLYDAISLILLLFKLKIRIFSTNTSNNEIYIYS